MTNDPRTRETFLKISWQPYPSAGADWCDVAQMLKRKMGWVGGRLTQVDAKGGEIKSAGAHLSFNWASDAVMEPSGLRKTALFDAAIFAPGDQIAIRMDTNSEAKQVLLLTPQLAPEQKSQFTHLRSQQWAEFVQAVRDFFADRDFIEGFTPTLVPSPGTEPALLPFSTLWHQDGKQTEFYLPTSPEFHLKKMLAAGWTRLFEIKNCFRNGEIGDHHQPEFNMLEWYRAYANLDAIADDVESLIAWTAQRLGAKAPSRLRRTTMAKLFAEAFDGFRLTPATTLSELKNLAARLRLPTQEDDSWDEVFFRLFLTYIEEKLGADGPILVRGYPPSQAALSRIGDDGFADRFEVYWRGLELANAFHELNDPQANEARFEADAAEKIRLGFAPVPQDAALLQALRAGLPPSGGIALGMERLFMALMGVETIQETRAFPLSRL